VKLQTSWKLEPCFIYSDSEGNSRAGAVSPVSLSQDSAQQVHDNECIVVNEQASDLSARSFTLFQQPSTLLLKLLTCQCIVLQMSSNPLFNLSNPPLSFFGWQVSSIRPVQDGSSYLCNIVSDRVLIILYFNARGLDELIILTEDRNPDVICITETWLSREIRK